MSPYLVFGGPCLLFMVEILHFESPEINMNTAVENWQQLHLKDMRWVWY